MKELKELRQKLGTAVTAARALHETAEKEDRGFTVEETAQWDAANTEIEQLRSRIGIAEKAGELRQFSEEGSGRRSLIALPGDVDMSVEQRAFGHYIKNGMGEMPDDLRDVAKRAFSMGTGNVGGFSVPQGFYANLEVALKAYGGVLEAGEIIPTDAGNDLPMPTFNYTAVAATIVGEGVASTADTATPFGSVTMKAYTYRSPILPVSLEFLQDSAFDEGYIINALGDSIGRGFNAHGTTGTGTGQPKGIVTDAVSGKVGLTGQTTSIISDDLLDLVHSMDPAYRHGGSAKFMMHDQSLKAVRKLKDNTGRPIFIPGFDGLANPMPDTILGYQVVINQDMAQMAANAKSVLFGQLNKYKVRIARNVQVLRLAERYADQLQVAFLLFARMDGRLLDAGTNPVKFYQNSAT